MPPLVAAIVFAIGILGLYYLDRGSGPRVSYALWIPAVWLFVISSRPLSMWLGMTGRVRGIDAGVDPTQAYLEGSPFDRAVYTFLLFAALMVLIARWRRLKSILHANVAIVLFFAFCAVSVLWSDFPFVAFKRWTKAVGDLAMVLIVLTESEPMAAVKRLVTRLGFLIFPLSILLFKYYNSIGGRFTNSWSLETTGVAVQKNQLGLDCMLFGVGFLWMFRCVYRDRENPRRQRLLLAYGTIIAMIIWLLNQCRSTTSIVGVAVAGAVMLVAGQRPRNPALVHVLVISMLGLCVIGLFFNSGGALVEAMGKDPTLSGRTYTWGLLLGLHTNPLVGTGFESFWLGPRLNYMREAWPNFPINQAHNAYLEVYINLGWVGVSFIALLLLTGYKRVISGIRRSPGNAPLLLGFLLCIAIEAFTENAFRLMTLSWVFLLLVVVGSSNPILLKAFKQGRQYRGERQPVVFDARRDLAAAL